MMKLFILSTIWNHRFIEESIVSNFFDQINLWWVKDELWVIWWYELQISNEDFRLFIPLFNWYFWKYFFYDMVNPIIDEKHIFGTNIYEYEYDQNQMNQIDNNINSIKKELESGKLITNSMKSDYKNIILDSLYILSWFLIKTRYLLSEMIQNKKQLSLIIQNKDNPIELRSQANLLDEVWFNKLEQFLNRYTYLNNQLELFAQILDKYLKTFINP